MTTKAPQRTPPPPPNQTSTNVVKFSKPDERKGHRALIYGPGGIGKTTLAALAGDNVVFIEPDESLALLQTSLKRAGIKVPQIAPCNNYAELRKTLQSVGWGGVDTIAFDTLTKGEEWVVSHTIKTVKHEKGNTVDSIEGYGFGKGYQHVFEQFLPLLGDFDRHVREGRNIILIAHECTATVPNPHGEDFLRYEPRLQHLKTGNASIRLRVKEWADHVLFLGYDINVKDGKAKGSGSRSLYTQELPHCMAKSRTCDKIFDISLGSSPWGEIFC